MSSVDTVVRIDTMASRLLKNDAPPSECDGVVDYEAAVFYDRHQRGEMPAAGCSDIEVQRARTVAAKLSLPHMGFVLARPRLHGLLDPVRGGGVVSLVAGPGYGKTALIVDLLTSSTGRTMYFSVDESDRDPFRFLGYLMAGLGLKTPLINEPPDLGWAAFSESEGRLLDLISVLMDHISGLAGQNTIIAIDDLHLVDSSPGVSTILNLLVRGLPPAWTVVLSSRRPLPLRLLGVALGGRWAHLQGRELRLTPSEVGTWALKNWTVRLAPQEARALWRLTQGWPAALVLLGRRLLAGGTEVHRRDISGIIAKGRDLRAYLERDILAGMHQIAAETVLAASMLPRVMFPRDDTFLPGEPGEAEALLSEFVSQGYLVTSTGPRSYTLHPLLRGYAERLARHNDDSGLLDRAATHLERHGEYHHAASLYLRAGRVEQAGRPLRQLTLSSLSTTVSLARDAWLDSLLASSASSTAEHPWLVVMRARMLQQQANYRQAVDLFGQAARSLSAVGDKQGLLPVLMSTAFCMFNQGLWEESLDVLRRCRSLARSSHERVEVLVTEGTVLVSLCRWDEAVENWERALAIAPQEVRGGLTQRVYTQRSRLFACMGQYGLAQRWAEKALAESDGARTPTRAGMLNALAAAACQMGDYEQGEQAISECLRAIASRGYACLEAPALLTRAEIAFGRWDYRSAVIDIKQAQVVAAESAHPEVPFWAETMLGDLCRRNSNPQRALEHHRLALEMAKENRLAVLERVHAASAEAIDLVFLGENDEAKARLEQVAREARRWNLSSSLTRSLFYLGWLHARRGHEAEAVKSLGEAMRIAEDYSHVHFFTQEGKAAVPVLALCDRFGARSFLRKKIVPALPEGLRDYFFELAEGPVYPTDMPLGVRRRLSARMPQAPVEPPPPEPSVAEGLGSLTDREKQILEMMAIGMSNKVIGSRLFISEKTVKTHANHVFHKLGVSSRLQATLVYQNHQRAGTQKPAGRRGRRQAG